MLNREKFTLKSYYNKEFLTRHMILSYLEGSSSDSLNKSGLSNLFALCANHFIATNKKAESFLLELEKTGSIINFYSSREQTYMSLSSPKQDFLRAVEIVRKLIQVMEFDEKSFLKAKEKAIMSVMQEKNSPFDYALNQFLNGVFNESNPNGKVNEIKKISLSDLNNFFEKFKQNLNVIYSDLDGNLNCEISLLKDEPVNKRIIKSEKINFLKDDLEQKVMFIGFKCAGLSKQDIVVAEIAKTLLANASLSGIYHDEIREKRSLAYFAFASGRYGLKNGVFMFCAGVAEKNLLKALDITRDVISNIKAGKFEDKKFESAVKLSKANHEMLKGEPADLMNFYAKNILFGNEKRNLDQILDQYAKVKKDNVTDFYSKILNSTPYILISGKLNEKTENKIIWQ